MTRHCRPEARALTRNLAFVQRNVTVLMISLAKPRPYHGVDVSRLPETVPSAFFCAQTRAWQCAASFFARWREASSMLRAENRRALGPVAGLVLATASVVTVISAEMLALASEKLGEAGIEHRQ